jgi:outer membrane protein assembly factor BamC
MNKRATLRIFAAFVLLLGVAACSSIKKTLPDRRVDYKREVVGGEDLEVPPDLTKPSPTDTLPVPDLALGDTATYSQYAAERSERPRIGAGSDVLPEMDDIEVRRDGDKRWLVIQADPDQVWPKVVSFWRENGILLVQEDPTVGVMETGWLENRADIKNDFITDAVRSVFDGLYTAATRDQFRVRLEEGRAPDTTELYLTHRGMQQKITTTGDTERPVWEPRPNDPELEAEMLRRIMVYLGVADKRAERALARQGELEPRSQLIKDRDGRAALLIDEDFSRAWRITGVALDRVGFLVEDRDRSVGTYYVRYRDPTETREKGLLSKLAFWSSDEPPAQEEYRITLIAEGPKTRVRVLDDQGQPDNSGTATRILTLLQEQIR